MNMDQKSDALDRGDANRLTVVDRACGGWAVVTRDGRVSRTFPTNAAAWAWVDRQAGQ
jgi:hypothetical protein